MNGFQFNFTPSFHPDIKFIFIFIFSINQLMLASPQNSLLAPKKQSLLQFPIPLKPCNITVFYEA